MTHLRETAPHGRDEPANTATYPLRPGRRDVADYPLPMSWRVARQIGLHSESNVDASGWLWELERGEGDAAESRRVLVLVTGPAFDAGSGVYEETVEAIQTEGRSEVERVARLDEPPRTIRCSTTIVEDVYRVPQ